MAEIESVGQAYEDAQASFFDLALSRVGCAESNIIAPSSTACILPQAQNARLLTSLAQRDEDASKMLQQVCLPRLMLPLQRWCVE